MRRFNRLLLVPSRNLRRNLFGTASCAFMVKLLKFMFLS